MDKIKVTHLGEDYSTIEVNGEEFEASLGLGEAIHAVLNPTKNIIVESVEHLKALSNEGYRDYFIMLGSHGGLRSSKRIEWVERDGQFTIFNLIDDTEQELTEAELMDSRMTNIGEAITKRALICEC